MTTIVYRDGVLAADSAVTQDGCHVGLTDKVARINGSLVTGCGPLANLREFMDWIRAGRPDEKPSLGEGFEGLEIAPDGRLWFYGRGLVRCDIAAPYHALGSGFRVALGALAMGATAKQAVEIACKIDDGTRGPVKVLRLDKAKKKGR